MTALTLLLLGCGSGDSPNEPPDAEAGEVDGWAVAREVVLNEGKACYRSRVAYCITDDSFIDPYIQRVLDQRHDGEMPATHSRARQVGIAARPTYGHGQTKTTEARKAVMERIEANWTQPTTTMESKLLIADAGMPPGKWTDIARSGWHVSTSPLVVDGWLSGSEVAGHLQRLKARHPDAFSIQVDVELPRLGNDVIRHSWTLRGDIDRIVLKVGNKPTDVWVSDKVQGDLMGIASTLTKSTMGHCDLKSKNWGDDPECPL